MYIVNILTLLQTIMPEPDSIIFSKVTSDTGSPICTYALQGHVHLWLFSMLAIDEITIYGSRLWFRLNKCIVQGCMLPQCKSLRVSHNQVFTLHIYNSCSKPYFLEHYNHSVHSWGVRICLYIRSIVFQKEYNFTINKFHYYKLVQVVCNLLRSPLTTGPGSVSTCGIASFLKWRTVEYLNCTFGQKVISMHNSRILISNSLRKYLTTLF